MHPNPNASRNTIVRAIMLIIAVLLVIQYLRNRSLWLDEAMLSLNIIEKGPLALLKPLDFSQVAPIAFLLVEKLFTSLLGRGELALRLFPLICALACLPLFFNFASALTKNRMIPLLALGLLACTPKFIYYSSEVKQYASDMFILCAIYFAAFSKSPWVERNRSAVLVLTGGIGVFLSNISVVPLFTVGALFFIRCLRNKKAIAIYAAPLLTWAVCIAVNYFLFVRHHPTEQLMKEYWKESFMPTSFHASLDWLSYKMENLFHYLLPTPGLAGIFSWFQPPHILSMVLYACSLIYLLWKRQFLLVYLCTAPIVLHLLLSALKIYPFDLRLVLYTVPLYVLVMASGLYLLSAIFFHFFKSALLQYIVAGVSVLAFAYGAFKEYPFENEEIRPIISGINRNIQAGSTVYVYYGSKPAFLYYQETGLARFTGAKIIMGNSHPNDPGGFLAELKSAQGPTWLLFSHVYPFDGSRGEEKQLLDGLARRGTLVKEFQATGSAGYLFELR